MFDCLTLCCVLAVLYFRSPFRPAAEQKGRAEETAMPHTTTTVQSRSTCEELVALGWEINANHYRVVCLAARYDDELDWFHQGLSSAALGISRQLDVHSATAREWIRIGHALHELPHIDTAFRNNDISYAKTRILTRWATPENEQQLLNLANERTADRLTTAIAKFFDENDDDEHRDQRHHNARSVTSYTDGDGMTIIRAALPPAIAKPILAAINELVRRIAQTPAQNHSDQHSDHMDTDASAGASEQHTVTAQPETTTQSGQHAPADAPKPLPATLSELRQRWQPTDNDDWIFPSIAQQHADAFAVLFLGLPINLTTEVVIHIRGDGNTFDDGTPLTTNAITRQLDHTYIRLMIHNAQRKPIDATNKRRYPTTRQKRVVLETHNHQCIDCQTTQLLELDHNPPHEQTGHTITTELQPRCVPCHKAHHRNAP